MKGEKSDALERRVVISGTAGNTFSDLVS